MSSLKLADNFKLGSWCLFLIVLTPYETHVASTICKFILGLNIIEFMSLKE